MYDLFDRHFLRLSKNLILVDLAIIVVFIFIRGLVFFGALDEVPLRLRLEYSAGIGSGYNYIKWLATAVFLFLAWRLSRQHGHIILAILFVVLLLEDMLEIHEYIGVALVGEDAADLTTGYGLRQRDFGELLTFGALGVFAALIIGVAALRSDRLMWRELTGYILLIGLLAVFGIGVDMLQIILKSGAQGSLRNVIHLMTLLLEEGGEMLVISMICAYSHGVWQRRKQIVV